MLTLRCFIANTDYPYPDGGGAAAGGGAGAGGGGGGFAFAMDDEGVREQDRFLPVANIARIMKRVLPANEKIAKDSKEAIQECVSEFISFITSEASDRCVQERRKTINGEDLLWAMGTLGFDEYNAPLKLYLQVSHICSLRIHASHDGTCWLFG
jgi:nuclear transcription Y subunit beta